MLNHVVKSVILIAFFLLPACNRKKDESRIRGSRILELSRQAIGGKDEYNKTRKQILDSLDTWCKTKLMAYESIWYYNYRLDSVLCFNSEKNRMVTAILVQCNDSDCSSDDVHYFYGAKINGKWYFFRGGGTMVILREHYQKDIHTPVSFENLHELATEEMLRGYVKKDKKGTWQINDAFFKAHFEGVNWGDFKRYQDTVVHGPRFANKKDYFESIYLRKSQRKWQHKAK